MNNLQTKGSDRLHLASVFNFKNSNPVVAPKTVNQVYYVEDCQINGDSINVDYTLNDNWSETIISIASLKSFVLTTGMNDYCYDRSVNGEHVQDSGSIDIDGFLNENFNAAVRTYLSSKRIGQNVN
jgi:hypothetical protein